jgi:hypothetical protein
LFSNCPGLAGLDAAPACASLVCAKAFGAAVASKAQTVAATGMDANRRIIARWF